MSGTEHNLGTSLLRYKVQRSKGSCDSGAHVGMAQEGKCRPLSSPLSHASSCTSRSTYLTLTRTSSHRKIFETYALTLRRSFDTDWWGAACTPDNVVYFVSPQSRQFGGAGLVQWSFDKIRTPRRFIMHFRQPCGGDYITQPACFHTHTPAYHSTNWTCCLETALRQMQHEQVVNPTLRRKLTPSPRLRYQC